jgi:hypothetical protein
LISRRFGRDDPGQDRGRDDGDFALEKAHERRILSWSPDPDEELEEPAVEDEPAPPVAVEPPAAAEPAPVFQPAPPVEPIRQMPPVEVPQPRPAAPPPQATVPQPPQAVAPAAPVPAATERAEPVPPAAAGQEPRKRGRPRGRPRRQVHFHVDPDEELLLLEAARKHGSQQKGLVAALQALQDNEVLRAEIERLRTECERQRVLLADAEALFNR